MPVDLLLAVLRLLLEERISIRNLPLILEAIAEVRAPGLSPESVAEHVRQRLSFQIVADLRRPDGTVPLIQLSPEWERTFATYEVDGPGALAMRPTSAKRCASAARRSSASVSVRSVKNTAVAPPPPRSDDV